MRNKDGQYIWTRHAGRVTERDSEKKPLRFIGGCVSIETSKAAKENLKQTLKELERSNSNLEAEVTARTKILLEQDKMLWNVNSIAQKLLTFDGTQNFRELVYDCLKIIGELTGKNRVFIWKDTVRENGLRYCAQVYEWVRGAPSVQDDPDLQNITYDMLPAFKNAIESGKCLNSLIQNLSQTERKILEPQGIKAILIAPVSINGKNWGFLGINNCETAQLFSDLEENTLLISGFLLANAIQKNETEEKIREAEERTLLMLNATPLCCNLWNNKFENIACNDEAVRLFDLTSQKEYLARFYELSPEYQPNGIKSAELAAEKIQTAFTEGYCRFEWLHQKIDGQHIPSEITLVRVKYQNDYIIAGYTRDLREQKAMLSEIFKAEAELRAAHEEAMLSSQAKTNFLANMSHEIRTPMNAISGLAEIILRESRGRAAAEYAVSIKQACANLLSIVNDILDISKIESGKLEIITSEYQLTSLLNDVINISSLRLEGKSVDFLVNIDSNLPNYLIGDEVRIKQILINLLSNAIKFTQKGHISLRVTGKIEKAIAYVQFEIIDTGCGIKKEDMERLFVEFERVNTKKNRSIEGTGLGLAISKRLCELMSGSISVTSEFGKGSLFSVTIPQPIHKTEPVAYVEQKKRILVYEPRELYLKSITETVKNLGCDCSPCKNQSDLYEKIAEKQHDYIFASSVLINKITEIVQKEKSTATVVMLSGMGESRPEKNVLTVFFPIHCLQVAAILNNAVNMNDAPGHEQEVKYFSAPEAKVLVVDDNSVNLKVATGLMAPYLFSVDTAENGLEALKKIKANKYDLVFMDHMMPEMDGIDATNAIRALKGDYFQKLPIVALTANALVGTREMFLNEGMNDFLAKPIELRKLNSILMQWLPKHLQKQLLEVEKESVQKPVFLIEGINTAEGLTSVGGDIKNYLQILSVYYEDGLKKCESLLKYFINKDITAFRIDVHALKSASASIGAFALSTHAQKLEAAAADGNTEYMEKNLDDFVSELKKLLDKIEPYTLPDESAVTKKPRTDNSGNFEAFTADLNTLSEALDYANIAEIERVLNKLLSYEYPKEIDINLKKIKSSVALFNYDEAQEYVTVLRDFCSK